MASHRDLTSAKPGQVTDASKYQNQSDPLNGDFKSLTELQKLLSPGTPVGIRSATMLPPTNPPVRYGPMKVTHVSRKIETLTLALALINDMLKDNPELVEQYSKQFSALMENI